ncbi:nitrate reductase molybdenum cofactor assembly chaperone [Commensalibacter sp. Nvir]|uniref:nitrate reductase molybdenum cofactor assembly chaperone n=1 Tax=Commensalibacter sp. Nvir TaxID=3069817 RepID=UPI0030C8986A
MSILLCYPEQELIDALSTIKQKLQHIEIDTAKVLPLCKHLSETDLISLQEDYVQTFDRTPTQSLHLFEHIHGEDKMRGQAMVDLLEEYRSENFDLAGVNELPDYLPLFLEFLSLCEKQKALELLSASIDVIHHIGKKLQANHSIYASIFTVLISLSPTSPAPMNSPPVHDMDEAMEKFGYNPEGIEPLLTPNACTLCPSQQKKPMEI